MCKWIDLDEICNSTDNNLTRRIARLVRHGKINGFENIDVNFKTIESPFAGRHYNLFYRDVKLEE